MKSTSLFKKSILAVSIATLTACSGGGSGTSTTNSTSGTSSGVVTGFGSVFVNGVEYETDSASISIDGVTSTEGQLSVGDVVTLEGNINADGSTGTATSISSSDEIEGYVLDLSNLATDGTGTINVMGQTVSISLDTVFGSDTITAITDLQVNDIVEVHGYSDGNGTVAATRIETKNNADDVEVKGLISALDEANTSFTLGSLTIDYSAATELPATLVDGLYVEAATNDLLTGDLATGFVMSASKVEIEEDGDMDVDGDEGEEIKVQGVVSDVTGTSFRFNGTLVEFSSLEDDDFDLNTLIDGMMVTVEGTIDANGDFVIEEIAEDTVSELEVDGTVTATTDTTITITDANNTTMTFSVNNSTRMIDEQDEQMTPVRFFSLADIAAGDYVEIEYSVDDTTGEQIATELKRDDISQMPAPGTL
ncbi:MAG TPA: hypothetical protein ENJ08_04580 [Gammaproteobacteria bacterium]|nr:hypothetical protein [Gammaproteobacteria bacterium]